MRPPCQKWRPLSVDLDAMQVSLSSFVPGSVGEKDDHMTFVMTRVLSYYHRFRQGCWISALVFRPLRRENSRLEEPARSLRPLSPTKHRTHQVRARYRGSGERLYLARRFMVTHACAVPQSQFDAIICAALSVSSLSAFSLLLFLADWNYRTCFSTLR